jgi:hypothetical protein
VRAGTTLYVVADDALHLGVFPADGTVEGSRVRLFEGELPREPKARKARKPDLETLLRLPAFHAYTSGALLTLGSGSKQGRRRGALLALDERGRIVAAPRTVDLAAAYERLEREIGPLNIEGAVATPTELLLLQRGRKGRPNAIVRYALGPVLDALAHSDALEAVAPERVEVVDLGSVAGVALGFTDAVLLADGALAFCAVAEDSDDGYHDGACLGSALGLFGADGRLCWLEAIEGCPKVEGVEAIRVPGAVDFLLVTDADDPGVPASLLRAKVARGAG